MATASSDMAGELLPQPVHQNVEALAALVIWRVPVVDRRDGHAVHTARP